MWGHSLSTFAKFSEKLTIHTPADTCGSQGIRIVSFLENFANVLSEGSLSKNGHNLKII